MTLQDLLAGQPIWGPSMDPNTGRPVVGGPPGTGGINPGWVGPAGTGPLIDGGVTKGPAGIGGINPLWGPTMDPNTGRPVGTAPAAPAMTFEEFLSQGAGLHLDEGGRWRMPGGGILGEGAMEQFQNEYQGLLATSQAGGPWGTAGLNFSGGQPASDDGRGIADQGSFYGGARTATINGKQYARIGEDLRETVKNFPPEVQALVKNAGPLDVFKDPTHGWVMPLDLHQKMSTKADEIKPNNAFIGPGSWMEAFGQTVGPAMGLSSLAAWGLGSLGGTAASFVPADYQSLFSSLSQNAASQGGSFSDILNQFGGGSVTAPGTGGINQGWVGPEYGGADGGGMGGESWGANPRADLSQTNRLFGDIYNQLNPPPVTGAGNLLNRAGTLVSGAGAVAGVAGAAGGGGDPGDLSTTSSGPPGTGGINPGWVGPQDFGSSGLTEGDIPAGETNFTPGSFELGPSGGLGGPAATNLLSRLLNGGNTSDWTRLAGVLGSTGLGVLGARDQNQSIQDNNAQNAAAFAAAQQRAIAQLGTSQTEALARSAAGRDSAIGEYRDSAGRAVAASNTGRNSALSALAMGTQGALGANQGTQDQYFGLGQQARDLLSQSYAPGFKAGDIAGYNDAVDTHMGSAMRALSTKGNPFDNPGGIAEANKFVMQGTGLPAIQNYRSHLLAAGNQGLDTSGAAALQRPGIYTNSGLANADLLRNFGQFDANLMSQSGNNIANAFQTTGRADADLIARMGQTGAGVLGATHNSVPASNAGIFNSLGWGFDQLTQPPQNDMQSLLRLLRGS